MTGAAPESSRPARPPAVLLLMAVLGAFALVSLASLATIAFVVARERPLPAVHGLAAGALLNLALLVGYVLLLAGLVRARRWARLAGLVFIALTVMLVMDLPAILPGSQSTTGAAVLLGGEAVACALGLWWAWAFAFSARARRHFGLRPITSLRQLFTNRPR